MVRGGWSGQAADVPWEVVGGVSGGGLSCLISPARRCCPVFHLILFSISLHMGPREDTLCLLWRGPGTSHKVAFLSSRLFFPSEGGEQEVWWLPGCHEGWEKGPGWEAKISCPGGWRFCSLAPQHAWGCRARTCVSRE